MFSIIVVQQYIFIIVSFRIILLASIWKQNLKLSSVIMRTYLFKWKNRISVDGFRHLLLWLISNVSNVTDDPISFHHSVFKGVIIILRPAPPHHKGTRCILIQHPGLHLKRESEQLQFSLFLGRIMKFTFFFIDLDHIVTLEWITRTTDEFELPLELG